MHVAVIGAGITGVTQAYALVQAGHEVTVIERLSGPGLETSRANAAQRSYGCVYPWASPPLMRKALSTLFSKTGPFKLKLPPSPGTLGFLTQTLMHAGWPGRFARNRRNMLMLADYSRECFLALEEKLGSDLSFDGDHKGVIELASSALTMKGYRKDASLLEELGIGHEILDADQVRAYETGLQEQSPLVGGLRITADGTGDCCQFSISLAKASQNGGAVFRFNTEVTDVVTSGDNIRGLMLEPSLGSAGQGRGDREWLPVDALVLCAGVSSRSLARGLNIRLPIYPVKGYSLTLPITDPDRAPQSTVFDDRYTTVFTRLGERIRVSGFVELAGLDRRLPQARLDVMQEALHNRFPGAADPNQAEPWAGFRPMTPDGPPVLGKAPAGSPDNLYLNTGHGTFGWTLSAGCANLVTEVIQGEKPAVDLAPYRADRFQSGLFR